MRTTWLVTATVLLAASVVHAEPPGLVPAIEVAPSEPTVESYRLQTFAMDAAAVGLFVVSAKTGEGGGGTGLIGLGLAVYALGGPALHIAHNRPGTALGSFVMRVGLPLAAAAIGSKLLDDGPDGDGAIAGAGLGIFVGAITASAIDIGYLSKGDDRPRAVPAVVPTNGGMTFGLAGSF